MTHKTIMTQTNDDDKATTEDEAKPFKRQTQLLVGKTKKPN